MKAGVFAIAALVVLILATAGCVQSPPAGNVTQPVTMITTASPTTLATVPPTTATTAPVTTTTVTTLPTIPGGGSFVFNLIGDHHVGDKFTISGTTNLAPGNQLFVEIVSVSFGPTNKSAAGQFYGTSGIVNVTKGVVEERNLWAFNVDTTGWMADLYQVTVSGVAVNVRESSSFNLLPAV